MGEFLGWLSYDLSYYCEECDEFYEEEDKEHEKQAQCKKQSLLFQHMDTAHTHAPSL